jgi:lysophospholipase L1-like esterase
VPGANPPKTDDVSMSELAGEFDYSNLNPRPTGPFVRAAALALPGVRRVQAEVAPYAAAWQRSNAAALRGSGPLWVALGDSMTLGIGASAHDQGWVGQLGRQLSRDGEGYRIVNLAFSGARVTDVLDRQLPAMRRLGQHPDLVTVLIGSNDATRKAYREALPSSYTLLLSRLPPGTVIATFGGRQIAAQVSQLIEVAARQRGLIIADMRGGGPASWRGRLAEDHFHPNDLGYAGMAGVFAEAIARRERSKAG